MHFCCLSSSQRLQASGKWEVLQRVFEHLLQLIDVQTIKAQEQTLPKTTHRSSHIHCHPPSWRPPASCKAQPLDSQPSRWWRQHSSPPGRTSQNSRLSGSVGLAMTRPSQKSLKKGIVLDSKNPQVCCFLPKSFQKISPNVALRTLYVNNPTCCKDSSI